MNTQYSPKYSSEEYETLEFLLNRHKDLHKQLNHEHLLFREVAAEKLLGSVFAGSPVSQDEANDLPNWKKVLHTSGVSCETLEDVARVTFHNNHTSSFTDEDIQIPTDRDRVVAIETRKECYREEYARLNSLRNELLAEISLVDDDTLVNALLQDVKQIESMQLQIEKRLEWTIGGPSGDTQKINRRIGSLYK